ncbi:hypothetical protein GGI35DRAFT_488215 [Trichoderma velutinum]
MAPVTCSVLDAHNYGVSGVHVILEYQDRYHNCFARLDAFTEHDGAIRHWASVPSISDTRGIPSQTLDRLDIPRASLTFLPHPRATNSAPWTSIRTDLLLAGAEAHVTLHLDQHPRLEYITPIIHASASDIQVKAPSPLRLPSSTFSLSGEYPSNTEESLSDLAVTQPSYKRKRGVEALGNAKKRRT